MRQKPEIRSRGRILFPLLVEGSGGSHLSAITVATRLRHEGWDAVIGLVSRGTASEGNASMEFKGGREVSISVPRAVFAPRWGKLVGPMFAVSAQRTLRRLGVAAVHTNDARMHNFWIPAARSLGIASVMNLRSKWQASLWSSGIAASRLVVNSNFAQADLPGALRHKCEVISPPVEPDKLQESHRNTDTGSGIKNRLGLRASTRLVIMVANLLEWKRPRFFLDVASRVLNQAPGDIVFALIGEDRDMTAAELRAELPGHLLHNYGCQRGIAVLGPSWPARDDIAEADLLCATSQGETFGRTLVEAFFAGVPVVASGGDGKDEVIGGSKAGIVVEASDLQGFAEAVHSVITDEKLRREMVAACVARAHRLDLVRNADLKFGRLYANLLTKPKQVL